MSTVYGANHRTSPNVGVAKNLDLFLMCLLYKPQRFKFSELPKNQEITSVRQQLAHITKFEYFPFDVLAV